MTWLQYEYEAELGRGKQLRLKANGGTKLRNWTSVPLIAKQEFRDSFVGVG